MNRAKVIESHVRMGLNGRFTSMVESRERLSVGAELFTHPQPHRQPLTPLTDKQIKAIINTIDRDEQYIQPALRQLARAIERAHGIGGEA